MIILLCALAGLCALLVWLVWDQRQTVGRQDLEIDRLREEKKAVFDLMHELGEAFTDTMGVEDCMRIVVRAAIQIAQARSATFFSLDAVRGVLRPGISQGPFPALLPAHRRHASQEILPALHPVFQEVMDRGWVLVEDCAADGRFPRIGEEEPAVESFMAVLLRYRGEKHGVLALANREDGGHFIDADAEILRSIGAQAAFALHNVGVYRQLAEKQRLDHDIEVARAIQRILLPDALPRVEGFEMRAINLPAQRMSGDYYDVFDVGDGCTGIAVADVSGKGVPASLVMAMCRNVLRTTARGTGSAAEVLRRVNRLLVPDMGEDMFITIAYMILDPAAGRLTVARAGHEPPLLCREGRLTEIAPPGMAVGIDRGELFDSVLADCVQPLQKGDAVVVYTDGVTEAQDPGGREFGREPLEEAILASARSGAKAIADAIVERLERFRGPAEQSDDITLISLYAEG
ncbi:MAG TPA: SpoIIE family protein phosphatase [Verrucomicrobiae bacterium]|nr:SpoIIE family protein phosphatase [Verrucomicrobiae bacterium]